MTTAQPVPNRLNTQRHIQQLSLEPYDAKRLINLCGPFNQNIKQVEKRLGIRIHNHGNDFELAGEASEVESACSILQSMYLETSQGEALSAENVHLLIQENIIDNADQNPLNMTADHTTEPSLPVKDDEPLLIKTKKITIKPKGNSQRDYVRMVREQDIHFGVGPAGTGKTYLAVACAVEALEKELVDRILLVRPAVEAGEKLGFLPGDLAQKIDPYLRPLYDALYEMLGFEQVDKMIERNIIEVAPLAYMRGRTINNAFVILDEAQNTTAEQMKMFLTRIGFGTTAVITGDVTQIDLPRGTASGLVEAIKILSNVKGIGFTHFRSTDVVRHPLVQRIVEAYESHQKEVDASNPYKT
ncbi:MAG: PhoH family protein [Pseudomonadales bacterium]|nr:PhoH family protein [Pseudomonadales bacterium]